MRKRWHEVIDRLPASDATLVEVGVWRGALSARLLDACPGLQMVLVDPWRAGTEDPDWFASGALMARQSDVEIQNIYQGVVATMQRYGTRVRILRTTSRRAADAIADGSCDAVFIDANHSAAAVTEDIQVWLPKIRPGGWIGGHDYGYPRFPGVKTAVDAAVPGVTLGADWTWFASVRGRS